MKSSNPPAFLPAANLAALLAALALPATQTPAFASAPENFNTMKFSEVVEKVVVIDAATQHSKPATLNQEFKVPNQVSTGANSRAELVAPDGTVTRIGANTVFSFAPDKREVKLQKGSVLLHSPTGKGGGVIATDSAQAAVMGTTLIVTATPNGGFKLLVLEGKAKATLPSGNSVQVTAGQLTLVAPGRRDFGPVLNFRLKDQVAGSALMKGFREPVASEKKVNDSVNRQERMIASGRAEPTNFRMRGDHLEEGNGQQAGPPPGPPGNEVRMDKHAQEERAALNVQFKGVAVATAAALQAALTSDVQVLNLGAEPASSLFYPTGANLPSQLSSIFGTTALNSVKAAYPTSNFHVLLARDLNVGGGPFPEDGNVSQFLFPNSPKEKIIASSGNLVIEEGRGPMDLQNPTTALAPGDTLTSERLLWVSAKLSLEVRNSNLTVRATDSFSLGTADASIPMTVTITDSSIYNAFGAVAISASGITGNNANIQAVGRVSMDSLADITLTNTWGRSISATSVPSPTTTSVNMTAANVIKITGADPSGNITRINAANISLDARTIVLSNVDFSANSNVVLKSSDGTLASSPNTGRAVVPLKVNFINGVKYGGSLITGTLPPRMTITTSGR